MEEIHYCVDWYPTFVPERELGKASQLVQEFEAKQQAKRMKSGHTCEKKYRGGQQVPRHFEGELNVDILSGLL
jgi:hypothetical protein